MELILKCIIAAIFGMAILGKLTGKTRSTFDKAGYSPIFMYGLALAESVLIIGLFTPYAFYATIGLLAIMVGAIFTLFRQKAKPAQYLLSIVATGLLFTLYWLQHSSTIQ